MKLQIITFALLLTQLHAVLPLADASEPELWPISVAGKWGFIDAVGKVKIEPQYAAAAQFSEGLALVSVLGTSAADQTFDRNYDGFIDKTGQFVIPAEFPAFYQDREDYDSYGYSSFLDGVAVVRDASSSSGLKGLIDRTGKLVAPMKFSSLGDSIGEGLCTGKIEQENGQSVRGYLNYQGKFVLQPRGFLYGSEFSDGRARINVRDDDGDHVLLIDCQGKVIVDRGEYDAISRIKGGLCRVVKDGEVGLIDRDGHVVIPPGEYDQILGPDPGTRYVGEQQGVFYAIGPGDQATRLPDFQAEPVRFRGDLIWIASGNKSGYARPDGTNVVEPIFNDLGAFNGQLARFSKGVEQGYVNRSGKIVWSTKNWERPLQNSIRDPLQKYLPDFGLEAQPLSYNWDCENAIVFVCDGSLEKLRKFYLDKQSADVKVKDYTNDASQPGKLDLMISSAGMFLEVFAMHGDKEAAGGKNAESFVRFYSCENMTTLRKKYPHKTIGIILEN